MKTRFGFTLVEILVVIVVLAILISVSVYGFGRIQQHSRDASREANAKVIAESLEKFYDKNGEYPSCDSLTADAADVKANTLPSIDQEALLTPRAAEGLTNSIKCQDIQTSSNEDYFAYVVDTNPGCQTGDACESWTLKYKNEESGTILQIQSRRMAVTP